VPAKSPIRPPRGVEVDVDGLVAESGLKNRRGRRALWRLQMLIRHHPVWFAREVLGVELWAKQAEILALVRDEPRLAVQSGNNVGKSFVSAVAVLWWIAAYPGSKVVTTATTWAQVESVLWTEIATLHARARWKLGGTLLQTEFRADDSEPGWVALGLSTNRSDSFVGRHAEHLLVVFDEAQGIEAPFWEAAETLASSAGCRILAIGNPVRTAGRFFEVCSGHVTGWRSLRISCLEHPNLVVGRDEETGELPIPAAVSPEYVDGKRLEWGAPDGPIWLSRIEGRFPPEGDWTLVPLYLLERQKDLVPEDGSGVHIGVDVARMGADSSVVTLVDNGRMRGVVSWRKTDLVETAGRIWKQVTAWENLLRKEKGRGSLKIPARNVHIEIDGIGAGVLDRLHEAGFRADAVQMGEGAGGEYAELVGREMRFRNRRSELHYVARRLLEVGRLSIPERYGQTWTDLTRIRYALDDRGVFYVEPKEKIRTREGRSPYFSDSLIVALARSRKARIRAGRTSNTTADAPGAQATRRRRTNAGLEP
jgi:phage terminase large subunit